MPRLNPIIGPRARPPRIASTLLIDRPALSGAATGPTASSDIGRGAPERVAITLPGTAIDPSR